MSFSLGQTKLSVISGFRIKAGVHLNVVFPPLNMDLKETSRSRSEQYKNCQLILLLYV